ncbi:ABC transporter ATP-binding protein [Sporichthya sp.]|uniref:ABC transporter ATP-binding protein n=1 Tax=Sporichthya sp. TaxID=65475 RepID=UPI001819C412|nr:ABC transporter ATP-binding protein [Sporichthya sp.]MBA3743279.1 ABC transporter ATP-binding protein [Sporichthya sp.]
MFRLENVVAGYGGTTVLRGVELSVPSGSVVALLGPNGAGKTTLLRVASGQLKPTSGAMTMNGEDVTRLSPHQLVAKGVCHVPEGRGVFPSLTVRDNLILQSAKGEEKEALDRAVAAFPRLGERLAQIAGTMSGGEQQMLALARTYVQHPTVVLLDEVSMGLAPKVVDEIFEFLTLLRRQGTSLLLVEQYVTRALEAADYVYLLNRGEIAFAGEPPELDGADVFASYVGGDFDY